MLKEFEFFHGVVLSRLLHASNRLVSVKTYPSQDNASYVLDDKIGIYIKFSAKRLSPWRFSFQKRHQEEILKMKNEIGKAFLLLVCNDDGIVTLSFSELRQILDEVHENVEWISAVRNHRQMYTVKGSNGKLKFKIGKDDFPNKIFNPESFSEQSTTAENIEEFAAKGKIE